MFYKCRSSPAHCGKSLYLIGDHVKYQIGAENGRSALKTTRFEAIGEVRREDGGYMIEEERQ